MKKKYSDYYKKFAILFYKKKTKKKNKKIIQRNNSLESSFLFKSIQQYILQQKETYILHGVFNSTLSITRKGLIVNDKVDY